MPAAITVKALLVPGAIFVPDTVIVTPVPPLANVTPFIVAVLVPADIDPVVVPPIIPAFPFVVKEIAVVPATLIISPFKSSVVAVTLKPVPDVGDEGEILVITNAKPGTISPVESIMAG